jgi:hypothetical protein
MTVMRSQFVDKKIIESLLSKMNRMINDSQLVSVDFVIDNAFETIKKMQERGMKLTDIAEVFSEFGIEIKESTLKAKLSAIAQKNGMKKLRITRPKAASKPAKPKSQSQAVVSAKPVPPVTQSQPDGDVNAGPTSNNFAIKDRLQFGENMEANL